MIGKVLGNRYEIVEKIGGGGMALVYKAKCRLLNRYVAIKILREEFINDDEFIVKFKRESQAAASLSHHNIVNVYDVGVQDNIYYIVMEYVKGKTLKEFIKERGKLSISEALDIAIQMADALRHAHKNHIIHRDIKPHNIIITDDGRAKVTDFGIARAATSTTVTNTNSVIGSVHYFSPEQARGGYTDEKSDIYSLGIVMYEMVTGRLPFQGDSPISVALKHVQESVLSPKIIEESIPANFEKIIMKCVKKDQSLRYSNANELLSDLKKCRNLDEADFVSIENINDSPTIIIPAVKGDKTMSRNAKRNNNENKNTEKKKKTNKKLITVAAIFSALLLVSILIFTILIPMVMDFLTVEEVEVPNVIGKSLEDAEAEITKAGLSFRKDTEEVYSSEYAAGYVIDQSEKPGEIRKVEYVVEVTVSKGQHLVTVPDLTNKHISDISIEFDIVDLNIGNKRYEISNLPKDFIISQEPIPFSEVPEGSSVDFVISAGPEISTILMPNLVGTNIEDAKREIVALGLVEGEISYQNDDQYPEDVVISQGVPSASEVEEYEEISLIVSLGPENPESNDGQESTEGNNQTSSTGGDVPNLGKAAQISIKLPQDREKVEVKVERIQDLISEIVYTQVHDTTEEVIPVVVYGRGRAIFLIYFDGKYFGRQEINFKEVD